MSEEKEEDIVSEAAEYSPKSDFSKALVVQTQVMKCNELRSKEMKEGYTTHILDKLGNAKIVSVPDARMAFIGSVEALKSTLTPEIKRKKEMIEIICDFEKVKEEIYEKYKYKEVINEPQNDGTNKLVFSGREYMPKKGEVLISGMQRMKNGPPTEKRVEGLWDSKINAYYDELLELYDLLYSELNVLIDANNYFKQQISF